MPPLYIGVFMIDAIVRSFLGNLGSTILDFYNTNSLWINGAILLYALLIILGRSTYSSLLREMTAELLRNNPGSFKNKSVQSLQNLLSRMELPWKDVISRIQFPFIVPPGKLRLYRKNVEKAEALIPPEILASLIHEQIRNEKQKQTDSKLS